MPSPPRAAAARRVGGACAEPRGAVDCAVALQAIRQLSLTFLDFLLIDRDTFSFLFSVFPQLRMQLAVAVILAIPLFWVIWRLDPFRAGRRRSLAILVATTVSMSAMSVAAPEQPWELFQGVNHISTHTQLNQ